VSSKIYPSSDDPASDREHLTAPNDSIVQGRRTKEAIKMKEANYMLMNEDDLEKW